MVLGRRQWLLRRQQLIEPQIGLVVEPAVQLGMEPGRGTLGTGLVSRLAHCEGPGGTTLSGAGLNGSIRNVSVLKIATRFRGAWTVVVPSAARCTAYCQTVICPASTSFLASASISEPAPNERSSASVRPISTSSLAVMILNNLTSAVWASAVAIGPNAKASIAARARPVREQRRRGKRIVFLLQCD